MFKWFTSCIDWITFKILYSKLDRSFLKIESSWPTLLNGAVPLPPPILPVYRLLRHNITYILCVCHSSAFKIDPVSSWDFSPILDLLWPMNDGKRYHHTVQYDMIACQRESPRRNPAALPPGSPRGRTTRNTSSRETKKLRSAWVLVVVWPWVIRGGASAAKERTYDRSLHGMD